MPIPHCFDYCSFVVLSEVWEGYASWFVLFSQDCFDNSESFMVPYKFLDYFSSSFVEIVTDNLIGISLSLLIALGNIAILTILILPIQEHGLSFHFFESSLITFINVLWFSA